MTTVSHLPREVLGPLQVRPSLLPAEHTHFALRSRYVVLRIANYFHELTLVLNRADLLTGFRVSFRT